MQMNLKETSSPITLMKEYRGYTFLYLSKSVEFYRYCALLQCFELPLQRSCSILTSNYGCRDFGEEATPIEFFFFFSS